MLHSVFFALMIGSPTHPPLLARVLFPPTHHTGQCPAPPPAPPDRGMHCACSTVQTAQPHLFCIHCLLEAACLAAHALPPGRGMDLNPKLRLMEACSDVVQWCSACLNAGCCPSWPCARRQRQVRRFEPLHRTGLRRAPPPGGNSLPRQFVSPSSGRTHPARHPSRTAPWARGAACEGQMHHCHTQCTCSISGGLAPG